MMPAEFSIEDMSANQPRVRDAVTGTYRGWSVALSHLLRRHCADAGAVCARGRDLRLWGTIPLLFHLYAEAFRMPLQIAPITLVTQIVSIPKKLRT